MANNFDSVEFMDTLIEGGFPDKQAKALASAMFQLIDSHLVTKSYLDMRLTELRAEFRAELAQLKSELIQWMFTILIVQTGVTAVLFKFLH
ncbi:CCDC90 family protein [Oxalobacteraceae bacterium OTU3CINTB1]|nr:CCDC90 family protein [Oxalobacteraceae bacterium OTU3CINTB1]